MSTVIDAPSKLMYHPERVNEIISRGYTNPVHITLGLNNYCNHRCGWCYIDFIRKQHPAAVNADTKKLLQALSQAKRMGVKAVTCVGDGEPTLHPDFINFIPSVKKLGLDIGIFTNGDWKDPGITCALLDHMTFVRFSVDAVTAKTHEFIHGSRNFERILKKIQDMVLMRKKNKQTLPTIGVQFAINHLNFAEAVTAVKVYRDIGVDYIAFKPVYKNILNTAHEDNRIQPEVLERVLTKAKSFETPRFEVLWKSWQMDALVFHKYGARPYKKCLAVWLSPYIDEDGNVEFCGNLKGRGFSIGNIYTNAFNRIWLGKQHRAKIGKIDVRDCPRGCKLHGLNMKLWEITSLTPEKHGNFI